MMVGYSTVAKELLVRGLNKLKVWMLVHRLEAYATGNTGWKPMPHVLIEDGSWVPILETQSRRESQRMPNGGAAGRWQWTGSASAFVKQKGS